jgi:RNA polymerase sigma-70 factor (ECF subfamily)
MSTIRRPRPTMAADDAAEPMSRLEPYQQELMSHAARMLGSRFEAEDAVQETMVRAWNALDRFQGRSQLRSWLYRICTNVCLDMVASRRRRPQPGPDAFRADAATATTPLQGVALADGDPAELAVARESIRLALTTMLQHLPPRQRSVLMLREVLHWRAAEVAQLLDMSVASVNSALQRARATVRGARLVHDLAPSSEVDDQMRSRVDRYARALESSDVDTLTRLLARESAAG